jgi:hypothetical protein
MNKSLDPALVPAYEPGDDFRPDPGMDLVTAFDRLWAVYEDGAACATCPLCEHRTLSLTRQRYRECKAIDPYTCPGVGVAP